MDGPGVGWRHEPGLDGVRGVAVIVVLLFHGGVSWARGGFLGVDAFFVLSGLLITSLLLDEAERTGRVDLGHFWSRRARRLLPALLTVVAASGAYAAFLAPRGSLEGLRRDAMATLLYVANWRFIEAGADYFESTAAPSILRHTWSLAIEEQFYLLWPLVMFGIARSRPRLVVTGLVAGIGALGSAAAMWMLFHPGEDTSRAYYGTDSRVQVVLIGALLAALVAGARRHHPSSVIRRLLPIAAAVGAVAFVACVAFVEGTETWLFRGGFVLVSFAVAAVLAHIVLAPDGWSSRAFSWTPLRVVGLVSYGLYLWHWPVFLTMTSDRTGASGGILLAAKLAVTAALAVGSYYLIELPIRRGVFPRLQAVVALPAAMAVAAAAVIVGTEPSRPSRSTAVAVARTASGYPVSPRPPRSPTTPVRVLVVGDSVALTLADRLTAPARRAGLTLTNKAVLGCGVVRGSPFRYFGKQQNQPRNCEQWPRQWADHVGRIDPDVVLAILGRWEVMDRIHRGRWTQLGDPVFDRYIEDELEHAVAVLSAGDAIVALATVPYFFRGERPDGGRWPEDDPTRVDRFNVILRAVAARHPDRVAVLELNEHTSRGPQFTPAIDGVSLRYDGVHFSPAGAAWLRPWLLGALQEMGPPVRRGRGATTTIPEPTGSVPRSTARPRPGPTTTAEATTTTTSEVPTTTTTSAPPPPTSTLPPLPLP